MYIYNRCINRNICTYYTLYIFWYLAIAIIAALDSVFGGINSFIKEKLWFKITFVTGFFGNAILSILLTILGQKLNVDIFGSNSCICRKNV